MRLLVLVLMLVATAEARSGTRKKTPPTQAEQQRAQRKAEHNAFIHGQDIEADCLKKMPAVKNIEFCKNLGARYCTLDLMPPAKTFKTADAYNLKKAQVREVCGAAKE